LARIGQISTKQYGPQQQSLAVDTISGATLTSKAFLQAMENALIQAQHELRLDLGPKEKIKYQISHEPTECFARIV